MKKETKDKGKITELNLDKDVDIAIKDYKDGTSEFIFHFKNLKEKKKLKSEAKKLNLSPEGYVKILMLGGLSRKDIMKIVDEYGSKNKGK